MPSDITLANYSRVVAALAKRGGEDLNNKSKIMSLLTTTAKGEAAKTSSISSNLSAVIYHTRDTPICAEYKAEMMKYIKQRDDAKTGGITPKSVEWASLRNVYKQYEGQDRVILAMYSLVPPRRIQDYATMQVVGRKPRKVEGGNYLVINKSGMKFIFGLYKTFGTYGVQTFNVPYSLREEFVDFAVIGKPLFSLPSGQPYAITQFSTHIGDLTFAKIGVRATANTYRHSYLSYFDAAAPLPAKRREVAEFMGHSVDTALDYVERDEEE